MYNLKEGIVTYHDNSRQVNFMNKSALDMLTDKSMKDSNGNDKLEDDADEDSLNKYKCVANMMFKRVTIDYEQFHDPSSVTLKNGNPDMQNQPPQP